MGGRPSTFGTGSHDIPLGFTVVLMLIDSYAPSSPVPQGFDQRDAKIWLSNLDILNGCYRSLVKYYMNQTPCSCLDDLYSQLQATMPKMGACTNCKQTKERTNLFICTGCERITYCSKLCQVAHVSIHKEYCKTSRASYM